MHHSMTAPGLFDETALDAGRAAGPSIDRQWQGRGVDRALLGNGAGEACSGHSGNSLKIIALNICMFSLRKYVLSPHLVVSTPSILQCWKDGSTKDQEECCKGL